MLVPCLLDFICLPHYCCEGKEGLAAVELVAVTTSKLLFLLLLLFKKVGSARLRESDIQPISLKTPAPQYQPIDRKKRKGKRVEDYSRDRAAYANK